MQKTPTKTHRAVVFIGLAAALALCAYNFFSQHTSEIAKGVSQANTLRRDQHAPKHRSRAILTRCKIGVD